MAKCYILSLYQCHPLLYISLKDRIDKALNMEQTLQPLVWAATNGKEICVRKLLDAGAWFNDSITKDEYKNTRPVI